MCFLADNTFLSNKVFFYYYVIEGGIDFLQELFINKSRVINHDSCDYSIDSLLQSRNYVF